MDIEDWVTSMSFDSVGMKIGLITKTGEVIISDVYTNECVMRMMIPLKIQGMGID